MSALEAQTPRSAFRELSSASAKELIRDRKGSFSILFMVGFLFLIIIGINFAVNVADRPMPVVALSGDITAVTPVEAALVAASIQLNEQSANVVVTLDSSTATVLLDDTNPPQWFALVRALENSGLSASNITVTDTTGFQHLDLVRANLATIAAVGIMAVAFMGTAVPIVTMRERGTLRMLGTTPLRRLTFIAAQTPIRAAISLLVGAVIASIALTMGYITLWTLIPLGVTFVLGMLMFFAFAYLLASRSRNSELINGISVLIPILVMFASGDVFPKQVLPDWLQSALQWLPSSWFLQAAGADFAGMPTVVPLPILWIMMVGCTVAVALLAARIFLWDDRER